ncbi:hypothetical protein CSH63_27435 [Micromonospora tulbaghiae]|uniref:Uncharacterized protein n=1 Tax=Micromonospora tulbaghiae TaxID=479978 RepID=A0A386WRK9_9ACTN|nr:hypothetical protein [Micromonospora tulbaghiae]AYF31106.1 hypothetical protein CSH63_27435 [Micromonospora tulbaghiae]
MTEQPAPEQPAVTEQPGPELAAVPEPAADESDVLRRVADAQAALDAAREAAAARLPGAGYVIATEALYVAGGARAHRPGDRVPVGNVVPNGWEHQVRPPADGE